MQEAWCQEKLTDKKVRCGLCIIGCAVPEGGQGLCRTRANQDGRLINTVYGRLSSFSTDFVEKVPLYHFYPNHRFLTIGGVGCNLHCRFCLTWNITQTDPDEIETDSLSPEQLVNAAAGLRCRGIAYTHSEPTLNIEFYSEVMERAHKAGLVNVFATNGFISLDAFERISGFVDAVALTFKGSPRFYGRVCGAAYDREHFTSLVEAIRGKGIHLEVVYVLIPGENDDDESLHELIELVKKARVPLIFLRFFPSYKMDGLESPSEESLEHALNLAYASGVEYAYMENIFEHPGKNTYCPGCKTTLIEREGYGIVSWRIKDKRCPECGMEIPITGEPLLKTLSTG
ncbi:MAG: AmmeMemoRadiSam system radical SAM enzyme [Methanobacteriota archaeon]|nr:MAG: AmmeMemoRadiSam system radical SAM enzyme [Euryarchaeota archaeon]